MESSIRSPHLHIPVLPDNQLTIQPSPKNIEPAECSTNGTASVTPPNPKNITTRMHNLVPPRVNLPRQAANQMLPSTDNQLKSAASAQNVLLINAFRAAGGGLFSIDRGRRQDRNLITQTGRLHASISMLGTRVRNSFHGSPHLPLIHNNVTEE
jgi:predicted component of type VI protein secretion system